MTDRPWFRRRQHFIKKGFQIDFSIRFLALIVVEAVLIAGFFWYLSLNTLTTGYEGSQLRIENTSSFFFPSLIWSNLIVVVIVGLIGIVGLVFISHRIAGPLYRFEKALKEMSSGDLSCRIRTRRRDQLTDMADSLNDFMSTMDKKVVDIKLNIQEIKKVMAEIQPHLSSDRSILRSSTTKDEMDAAKLEQLFYELSQRLQHLKDSTDHFKTSQGIAGNSDLSGPSVLRSSTTKDVSVLRSILRSGSSATAEDGSSTAKDEEEA